MARKSKSNVQKIREQISADIQFDDVYNDDKVLLAKSILEKEFTYEEMEKLKNYLRSYFKIDII